MCRLFGLSAGTRPVRARLWLLDSPNSLAQQSRHNPDGYGIATFRPDGTPDLDRGEVAAWADCRFEQEAREERSTTYLAHVRHASMGAVAVENSHPFLQDGRFFAHNGVVFGLDRLEARLGDAMALVAGDTDSERVFALITKETRDHGGDLRAGIGAALRWIAAELPLYSVNFVLTTPTELYALRYPEGNTLYMLDRPDDDAHGEAELHGDEGPLTLESAELGDRRVIVVASEHLDDDPGWRELASGELLHVGPDLRYTVEPLLTDAPAHALSLADLDARAAASQASPPA